MSFYLCFLLLVIFQILLQLHGRRLVNKLKSIKEVCALIQLQCSSVINSFGWHILLTMNYKLSYQQTYPYQNHTQNTLFKKATAKLEIKCHRILKLFVPILLRNVFYHDQDPEVSRTFLSALSSGFQRKGLVDTK